MELMIYGKASNGTLPGGGDAWDEEGNEQQLAGGGDACDEEGNEHENWVPQMSRCAHGSCGPSSHASIESKYCHTDCFCAVHRRALPNPQDTLVKSTCCAVAYIPPKKPGKYR